jgi:RecJ-like exonuclease
MTHPPPGTEHCDMCDGWGQVDCPDCDGQGWIEIDEPTCRATWLDMTVDPFVEQRCDRQLHPYSTDTLCLDHRRQERWRRERHAVPA